MTSGQDICRLDGLESAISHPMTSMASASWTNAAVWPTPPGRCTQARNADRMTGRSPLRHRGIQGEGRARPCRDRKEPRTTGAPMRSLQIDMALLDGERLRVMARAEMPRGNLIEGGLILRATLACHRTARVEPAAGRRIERRGRISGEDDALARTLDIRVGHGNGRQQGLRVRMGRSAGGGLSGGGQYGWCGSV